MGSIKISGLGSGIDWQTYVDAMVKGEQEALARTLGSRQVKVSAEATVLAQVQGLMEQLKTTVSDLKSARDLKTKNVSTSDDTVITATAALNSINQAFTVRVDNLALNEVWQAQAAGATSSVTSTDQTLTIWYRGVSHAINVPAGTTLEGLASLINNAGIGVSSTVYDTGNGGANPARLSITDNTEGKFDSDQLSSVYNLYFSSTLTGLTTTQFGNTPIIAGTDSKIYLNGNTTDAVYRDTNTVSEVIPGVILTLLSADNAEFKTMTVTESTGDAVTKVKSVLKAYNNIVAAIRKAVKYDTTQEVQTNPTAGNSTLRGLLASLTSAATSSVSTLPADKTIRSLSDIGITSKFSSDNDLLNGQLDINEATFNAAVQSDFDNVVAFFEGATVGSDKVDGWAAKMTNSVQSYLAPITGSLTAKISSIQNEGKTLDKEIQKKLLRIQDKADRMAARFARLEAQMAKLTSQQSSLTAAVNSIALNNNAIANRG